MEKIGIIGHGHPLILISEHKDMDESDLLVLAESNGVSREQIEVVPSELFEERSKELTKNIELVMLPKPIELKDINWYHGIVPKIAVERDDKCYSNRIAKRRKKKQE